MTERSTRHNQDTDSPLASGAMPAEAASPTNSSSAAQRAGVSGQRGYNPHGSYAPQGPRRVKHGLKLSSRDGPVARTALASRWLTAIHGHIPADAFAQGLEYARSGQIVSMQVLAGEIEARVQGTAPRAYTTRISIPALSEQQWDAVIRSMAEEAIGLAKIMAGELPPGLDQLFATHHVVVLPQSADVRSTCTCAAGAACKHVSAAAHLLADQLSDQPLILFTLLGQPVDRVIERLRQARVLHTQGMASAHGESTMQGYAHECPPLESVLDDFWRSPDVTTATEHEDRARHARHALLRRLGPSPLNGRFPMVGLLASIYDTVAQAAQDALDSAVQANGRDQTPAPTEAEETDI